MDSLFFLSLYFSQTEIAKRLSALINQLLPCLQPEHQQSVLQAVERAKQVTMPELNAIIGVSVFLIFIFLRIEKPVFAMSDAIR